MKRPALALLAGLVLLSLLPGATLAAAALDQSNGTGDSYSGGAKFAQTFTAGMTGALTEVDLYLAINGSETDALSIGGVNGLAEPDGTVLASTSALITGSNISTPAWVQFTFSTPTHVTSGTQYSIVFTSTNAQIYGTTGNGYAGGAAQEWVTSQGQSYWVGFGQNLGDFSFRTYVDPAAPAPTPTAFQSFQGETAVPSKGATAPPTSTADSGGTQDGGTTLPFIVASLAAAAALVTLRRQALVRR